nr:hypothetical protein [Tanacetum cinerariifolium]
MCHKITLASDTSIDFQIDFSVQSKDSILQARNPVKEILLKFIYLITRRSSWIRRILKDGGKVSVAGPSTSTARDLFEDEMTTMVDTLMAIRSTRPRTTSVVIHNVEEEPRKATPLPTIQSQEKEIAQRMFEEEQAQFKREQRIAREKAAEQEAKDAVMTRQIEDIQARMDADALLEEKLQQEER